MKTYQSWLLGALACATIVPFTGCTKDEMDGPNGGDGEMYNTEFTVAFSQNKKSTKATNIEVGEGDFQGMNVKLLAFTSLDGYNKVQASSSLNSENTLEIPSSITTEGANFVHKFNIALNPATVSFLFYGESAYTAAVGELTPAYTTAAANSTTFSLTPLEAATNTETMTNYIKSVVSAVETSMKTDDSDVTKTKLTNFFNSCTSPGLYQVAYMMAQLYSATDLYTDSGTAVKTAIANGGGAPVFSGLTNSETADTGTGKTLIDVIMGKINTANENYLNNGDEVFPKGGKVLKIKGFSDSDVEVEIEIVDIDNDPDDPDNPVQTYYKPTSLWYYANTYPVEYIESTADDWVTKHEDQVFVDLSTQPTTPIALYDPIQYAVGQLNLTVKVKDEIVGNDAIATEVSTDNYDSPISAENIKLMGVLINNQKNVGWDFQPNGTDDNSTHIAYDYTSINNPDTEVSAGTGDKTMKMLALPTKPGSIVELVLEMKNSGSTAFKGVNGGIIPAGATFYVVAKLDPTGKTVTEGTVENPAVFMSDYKTTVTLNLESLKSAYNTVPDLSASNLEFALSVDLDWKGGIEFNETIE